MQGIFATCNKGKEFKCLDELYQLFERSADELYGPEKDDKADDAEDKDEFKEEEDVEDIEASIAAELKDIESEKTSKTKRFTLISLDTPCLAFIHTRLPVVPTDLVYAIFDEALSIKKSQTRYTQRLTPIMRTARATLEDIERIAKEALAPHFHGGQKDVKFAIRPNLREHNSTLGREEIIHTVAKVVGPGHIVDLKNYDLLILVEVLRVKYIWNQCRERRL